MTISRLLKGKGDFVPSARPTARISDIIDQLEVDNAGALVIMDDDQEILGIISERDIVRGLKWKGRDLVDEQVTAIMSSPVITCDYGEPLSCVLQLMDANQIRHIPIVKDGKLCGIVNMLDLVKYRLGELEFESESLKQYVAGQTR